MLTDRNVHAKAAFARRYVVAYAAAVPAGQGGLLVGARVPFAGLALRPFVKGWRVESVQAFCTARTVTASLDVLIGAVSVLVNALTPFAGSVVSVPVRADRATAKPTDQLNVRVTTDGTGTITDLWVAVTIRPFPLDGES